MKNLILNTDQKDLYRGYVHFKQWVNFNCSSELQDDSLKDLRQVAYLVVWQATEKYLVGCTFKGKK